MRTVRGQEGAALVTALLLTMLSLVVAATLLYSVTMGTKTSASQKRYKTVLAAAHGGIQVFADEIVPKLWQNRTFSDLKTKDLPLIDLAFSDPDNACLQQKIKLPRKDWNPEVCPERRTSSDPMRAPDASFVLQGEPLKPGIMGDSANFTVFAKIVDTIPGNTGTGGTYLDLGSSVAGNDDGTLKPQHVPYMYSIAVQGERSTKVPEKARLSVLYAF